ncbi:MAG: hypothetical protein ACE5R4_08905 [Armatimonadota bacterium]
MTEPNIRAGRWRAHVLPLVVLGVLAAAFFWRPLFGGQVLAPALAQRQMEPWRSEVQTPMPVGGPAWEGLFWDAVAQFIPWRVHYARTLRSGEVPLWNPYQFCGTPFLANAQSAVLYPPNLIFVVFDPLWALGLGAMLHVWFAAACTYLFMRRLGAGAAPALLSGIAFAFSGFIIAWIELPTVVATASWLPFGMLMAHRLFAEPSWTAAGWLGLGGAMALLAGHPQIAIYVLGTVALYCAARLVWFSCRARGGLVTYVAGGLAVAALLALLIPMAQLLPTLELGQAGHREAVGLTQARWDFLYERRMWPMELTRLVMPDFYGSPANGTFVRLVYSEHCAYAGVVVLVLALAAVALRAGRHTIFFGVLAACVLLVALGTPLAKLLLMAVPPLAGMGSFTRSLFVFAFAAAVLAGLACQAIGHRLEDRSLRRAWTLALAVAPAALLAGVVALWLHLAPGLAASADLAEDELLRRQAPGLLYLAAGAAIWAFGVGFGARRGARGLWVAATLATVVELFGFGMGLNPVGPRDSLYARTESIEALSRLAGAERVLGISAKEGWQLRGVREVCLPPNSCMVYGLHGVQGYDSLYPAEFRAYAQAAEGGRPCPLLNGNMVLLENVDSPLLDLAAMRCVLSPHILASDKLVGVGAARGVFLYVNRDALPRAYVGEAVLGELDQASLAALATAVGGLRAGAVPANITYDGVNRAIVSARAPEGGSHLVLADALYPGWTVSVDGSPGRLERANYLFRAVRLPEGDHSGDFVFLPASFRVGAFLSLLGAGLLAGLWALCGARRRAQGGRWT